MAGIEVSGEARARTFGEKLKLPEKSGGPMASLNHFESFAANFLKANRVAQNAPRELTHFP
jgi:hypothetical protein